MTDTRPIIQAGVEFAADAVTPDNPHGFLDADGRAVWRRLDKPECVPLWRERLEAAVENGCQGLLWWQPAGHVEGRPQYLVDSHLVPPDILPQFIAVNGSAHELGLWVGSLLRPAELAARTMWDLETSFTFKELTDDVKTILGGRVSWLDTHGAGDAFYLDSFSLGDPDAATLRWLCEVAPQAKFFVEAASDRTLGINERCGGYCEWSGTGWTIYGGQRDVLAELYPDRPWIAVDRTWRPFRERAAWGKSVGVAPLVLSEEIPTKMPIDAGLHEAHMESVGTAYIHHQFNARMDAKHAAYARRYGS